MSSSSYNPNITLTSLSTQQGEINLVTNPIAQTDVSNWTTSSATLTRSTTGVLSPVIPTGFTASSTTSTTSYVQTSLLTVPATLRNRKLKVQLYIQCSDTATWKVDVLKSDGSTRYTLSTDASGVSALPALTGTYTTTFDMDTGSGIYVRLTRYAGSGTSTLSFTNLIVGPGIQPQGAALQDWITYTPTGSLTSNVTYYGRYRRVGSNIEGQIRLEFSGVNTQGILTFTQAQLLNGLSLNLDPFAGGSGTQQEPLGTFAAFSGTSVFSGFVKIASSGVALLVVNTSDAYFDTSANRPFTIGSGNVVNINYSARVLEWIGSGTVQLAQNDVEYASNNGSGGTAANTAYNTGMTYGPAGNNIVAVASVSGGYQVTSYKVSFQTPIQPSDVLQIEILTPGKTNWIPISDTVFSPSIRGTGYRSGMIIDPIDATSVYVSFGNGGAYSNNATYDAAGAAWSTQTGYKWRVRKSSAGAAVGFGIVSSQSAGLLPVSNSNLDDATATRLGLKEYLHGTAYNSGIAPTVTASMGGTNVARGAFVPYQVQDGTWRLRFNVSMTYTLASIASATVSINGIVFRNVSNFLQAVSVFLNSSGAINTTVAYTNTNTNTIQLTSSSTATSNTVSVSGDVELESKPTWAY